MVYLEEAKSNLIAGEIILKLQRENEELQAEKQRVEDDMDEMKELIVGALKEKDEIIELQKEQIEELEKTTASKLEEYVQEIKKQELQLTQLNGSSDVLRKSLSLTERVPELEVSSHG